MATVKIRYCTGCRWLLRASWMAQELLTTFEAEIDDLVLSPASGGCFEVYAENTLVWSRERDGGFPEISELKRRVRDVIAPERALGHNEKRTT
ncbi:MAG: SelT/SelW/SelH family protein [Pseudomonadota bacterium]